MGLSTEFFGFGRGNRKEGSGSAEDERDGATV